MKQMRVSTVLARRSFYALSYYAADALRVKLTNIMLTIYAKSQTMNAIKRACLV